MEKLKRDFRLAKIITVLVVIICALLVYIAYSNKNRATLIEHKLDEKQQKELAIKKAIEKEATIISKNVDQFGAKHAIIDATEKLFPKWTLKSTVSSSLDTPALRANISKKQIQDLTTTLAQVKAEKLIATKQLDSLKRLIFSYSDRYVKLKFTPGDSTTQVPPTFDFSYDMDLTAIQYWKRKFPLIGAKRSYIDLYSSDPRTTINSVKKFTVEQANPKFGLRLQLRSIYGITSHKFYAGPGLSFDFGRLNFVGFSYYNYSDNRWQNTLGINYDLIRF